MVISIVMLNYQRVSHVNQWLNPTNCPSIHLGFDHF